MLLVYDAAATDLNTYWHALSLHDALPISATRWAQTLHFDAKPLQRLCAREIGMSFGQWRQQARLLTALELLAQGERVLDVALALGYASPGAFATMFKRQFGVTPSAYFS